jgi:DNA-binding GntR family transcriptional regulator
MKRRLEPEPDDPPEAAERVRGSGVRIVYEQLRDWILNLAIPPGTPIDEVELSERFRMSRTPVREALVRLAAEGLVTTLPNRSSIVANIDFLNLHTFFDALTLMYRVTTRLAAEFRSEEDLAKMRAYQAEFAAAVEARDALEMIRANREMHVAIAEAARNPYYLALFARLLDEGRRILRLYYSSFDDKLPQQYVEEHEQMIAAIAAQDIEASDRLAAAHADQIVRQIRTFIATDRRRPIAL